MRQYKEFSVRRNIAYEKEQGLDVLVHDGHQRLVDGGFRPRFLDFKGGCIEIGAGPDIYGMYAGNFSPDKVDEIALDYCTKVPPELTERVIEYVLGYRDHSGRCNEFLVDLYLFSDSESPALCGLSLNPSILKLETFRRKHMIELDKMLERYVSLLGVTGLSLKRKRSKKEELFVRREGPYDEFDLNKEVILNVVNVLSEDCREEDRLFRFKLLTFPDFSQHVSLELYNESQRLGLSGFQSKDIFGGLQDLLPDRIQFTSIGYDSSYYREHEKQCIAKEGIIKRLLKRKDIAELSREEIQAILEKRYYLVYRRSRLSEEIAKREAHIDSFNVLNRMMGIPS